jgi:hypothetical protein
MGGGGEGMLKWELWESVGDKREQRIERERERERERKREREIKEREIESARQKTGKGVGWKRVLQAGIPTYIGIV